MDCMTLKKRFDQVSLDRSPIEGIWDLIEQYVVPFSSKVYGGGSETEINWRKRNIYDSTAIEANEELASNLQSGMINFSFRWFDYVWRDDELMRDEASIAYIQNASRIAFETLQDSNFELEAGETFHALPSYGTGPIVEEVEEAGDGSLKELIFSAIPIHEAFFEEDHRGRVEYFYRKLEWSPLQLQTKFGKESLPDNVKAKLDKAGSDDKFTVIFAIFPRPEYKKNALEKSTAPEFRPYGYKYFLYDDAHQVGKEGGYFEMPAFVPRWRKTAGSRWGYSPAMVCLSDVLTLNQLVELVIKAGEKVVDPPVLGTRRGVFGDVDLRAGGYTVVADKDSLTTFESKARFDVSQLSKEELQKQIRAAFFADKLELKKSPEMTATEVQARLELMARLMGPTIARITIDFLDLVLKRTYNILYRYNKLGEVPQLVKDRQGELDIEYRGPMARAQRMDKVMSIERWLGMIAQAAEAYPEMLDVPDAVEIAREMALLLGVPQKLVRSRAKVTSIQKLKQTIQEQQQQIEMMARGSEGFKNVAQGAAAFREEGMREAA